MNEEEFIKSIEDNVRDAQREDAPFDMTRYDVTHAFEVMGAEQMIDLWEHTGVPVTKIREILVQAHNFIVIG